jgi:NAD(P)-dependent dehydrogenase (short-subunit alcohol dehydrogenase family)
MTKFILVTGASKGIGRATADALAASGWTALGITRHEPKSFPGPFMTADLSDREATAEVASRLALRSDVFGIVTNGGALRHEGLSGLLKNRSRIVPGRLNRILNALVTASLAREMEADFLGKGLACRPARAADRVRA